ncbi:MAG: hypothetical protein ACRDHZ_01320 [Ktedonobacteraceae bacterium]
MLSIGICKGGSIKVADDGAIQIVQPFGKILWQAPAAMTYVATYTKEKDMQREVALVAQHGWMLQAQSAQAGKSSAAKVIGGALLLGPLGALAGAASRSKGKITVTYVRTPQWLAYQHRTWYTCSKAARDCGREGLLKAFGVRFALFDQCREK